MATAIQDLLRAEITTGVISRISESSGWLLRQFNMQQGGSAESVVGHRQFGYDIFNNTRNTGTVTAPATAATRITRQKVGRVEGTFPRFNEQLFMDYESIHNMRRIGGPSSSFDRAGADYITKQERFLAQRHNNWRSAMLLGILRGGLLYMQQSGAVTYWSLTSSGAVGTLNWQIPAANKSQLDMLGNGDIIDASWADPNTDIPLHLEKIDEAFTNLCGWRLEVCICTGILWNYITSNDFVAAKAGIAGTPYEVYKRQVGTRPDGKPIEAKFGVLKAVPWVEFWITNDGIGMGAPGSETFTKFISDDKAFFMPQPSPELFEMLIGDEVVVEYENGPEAVRAGLWTWSKKSSNPAGYELFALDNCMPALYVPNAVACGTVTGF